MKIFKLICILFIAISFFCSCSPSDELSTDIFYCNTCSMTLQGNIIPFDFYSKQTRSNSESDWKDGDKLYVIFQSANGSSTNGIATYNSFKKSWDITYESTLLRNRNASCKVYYFDMVQQDGEIITLDATNAIYADENASYYFDGNLTVTANIKPLTSRIRFHGIAGTEVTISGISHYKNYSKTSGLQERANNCIISVKIQNDGYTPYIYGLFESVNTPSLTVAYGGFGFSADCRGTSMLQAGVSGWMNIPTESNHYGWAMSKTFVQNGHQYVDLGLPSGTLWATCNVGANSPEEFGDYFAWGETEGYLSGKRDFSDNNYKYGTKDRLFTKYCDDPYLGYNGFVDNKTELDLMDDAAFTNWGAGWRTPSMTQFEELISNCNVSFSKQKGTDGYKILGKNGQYIFLPKTGNYWYDLFFPWDYADYYDIVFYWTRNYKFTNALYLCLHKNEWGDITSSSVWRCSGLPIRAVYEK